MQVHKIHLKNAFQTKIEFISYILKIENIFQILKYYKTKVESLLYSLKFKWAKKLIASKACRF